MASPAVATQSSSAPIVAHFQLCPHNLNLFAFTFPTQRFLHVRKRHPLSLLAAQHPLSAAYPVPSPRNRKDSKATMRRSTSRSSKALRPRSRQ
eukprot:2901933-Rhodomonas_salina.1